MFQIYNGGTTFKQWTKDNKLVMDLLPVGADVLFYSESYADAPLKSDVYEMTVGKKVIKVCDVPNTLLTKTEKIKVCVRPIVTGKYGVDHSMVGPREKYFEVEPADRPSDYVEDPVDTDNGGNVGSSGGVSSWNDLTDKPFYKDVTVVNEPLNINIDYDTFVPEVVVNDMLYKVSDVVLTNDEIKKTSVYVENTSGGDNETVLLADLWDDSVNEGVVTDELCIILGSGGTPYLICVRDTESSFSGISFPETGLYLASTHYFRITSITTSDPIEQRTETIKTIDPEFMPEGYPYYGEPVKKMLVPETTIEFDESLMVQNPFVFLPVGGETYSITYDGVVYERIAVEFKQDVMGAVLIGNSRLLMAGDDTGEPFLIAWISGQSVLAVVGTDSSPHTISIEGITRDVHPIDSAFLPVSVIHASMSINGDEPVITCDRTYEEIYAALTTGDVVMKLTNTVGYSGYLMPMISPFNEIIFTGLIGEYGTAGRTYVSVYVTSDKIEFSSTSITMRSVSGEEVWLEVGENASPRFVMMSRDNVAGMSKAVSFEMSSDRTAFKFDSPIEFPYNGKYYRIGVDSNGALTATEVAE